MEIGIRNSFSNSFSNSLFIECCGRRFLIMREDHKTREVCANLSSIFFKEANRESLRAFARCSGRFVAGNFKEKLSKSYAGPLHNL